MPSGVANNPTLKSERMRAAIVARQAAGMHFGRRRVYKMRGKHCSICGAWFRYKHYPAQKPRRVCSPNCAAKTASESRRLIPEDFDILYDLYWNQNKTTPEIAAHFGAVAHKPVRQKMIKLGIPLRGVGSSRLTVCIIEGCGAPLFKIRHTNNGSMYGRRCLEHWVAHRFKLAQEYWFQIRRWRKWNLGISGETNMQAIIEDAVPKGLPYEIREEVCQEIALQLLTRKTSYSQLRQTTSRLVKHFFREYQDKFGNLSLDAPLGGDNEGLTLGDLLDDRGRISRAA